MNAIATLNLLVRFLLELAALAALAWWGADAGDDALTSALLGAGLPLAAAALWTLFVAPRRRHELPRAVRFLVQVLVLGGAAAALVAADHPVLRSPPPPPSTGRCCSHWPAARRCSPRRRAG